MNWRTFIPLGLSPRWVRRSSLLVPRAVLGGRFYRPRSRHKAGETARTPHQRRITIPSELTRMWIRRSPDAVLLRFAIRKEKRQKLLPRPLIGPAFQYPLYYELNSWLSRPSASAPRASP